MSHNWVVVVPVKELHLAKTRLTGLGDAQRAEFALATARDVVAAALDCPVVGAVYVVTNDVRATQVLAGDGARVIPDVPDSGLNAALRDGARTAASRHPDAAVAALSSDLPALTSEELQGALLACERAAAPHCFVADRNGTGTAMLAARAGVDLAPAFGPQSRDLHLASGAAEVAGDWPGLRSDIDTHDDLHRIARLAVGRHTARFLRSLAATAGADMLAVADQTENL